MSQFDNDYSQPVTSQVGSLDRGLQVLEALAQAGPGGVHLSELAGKLGANKSTVHRALAVLRLRQYALQDPVSGAYSLGPHVVQLADLHLQHENLPALLDPAIRRINHETDELVHLGLLNLPWVTYIAKVEPEHPVRVWSRIGSRAPAATTALGRAILATLPTLPLSACRGTGKAIDRERLTEVIKAARCLGYATELGENEPGIACVGVAILRHGTPCAAVSVTVPIDRMGDERVVTIAATARRILASTLPEGLNLAQPTASSDNGGR